MNLRALTKSITWRLQFWHAAILLLVVVGLSTAWFMQTRRALLGELDAELLSAARVLDGSLRGIRLPTDEHGVAGEVNLNEATQRRLSLPRLPDKAGRDSPRQPAYFAIWLQDGRLLKSERLPAEDSQRLRITPTNTGARAVQRGRNREVEIVGPSGTRILVGRNVDAELDTLNRLAVQIAGLSIAVLALGLAGGWWLTRSVLRPIHAMSATARRFSAEDMSPRIDTMDTDTELGELARLLNEAFDRVQSSFDQQQQFAADASHELRTPLAVIQSQIELALRKDRAPEDYVKALRTCGDAGQRLSELVESMLTLARLDSREQKQHHTTPRLDLVVAKCVDMMRPVADHADVTLIADISAVPVAGDAQQLEHAILNLLKNAITYNRPGGSVQVTANASDATAKLRIRDTGIGINSEDLPRITERFYRVDKARSRQLGGSGLGLAIAKQIIESHRGTIEISSTIGAGTEVTLCLPLEATHR